MQEKYQNNSEESVKRDTDQSEMSAFEASNIITDEYAVKILVATYRTAKSAIELSHRFGIPIAACYRRIHTLENVGLLTCIDKVLTQKGKRVKIYISQLKNAYIFFERGKFRVKFEMKTGETENFVGECFPSEATQTPLWPHNKPSHDSYSVSTI